MTSPPTCIHELRRAGGWQARTHRRHHSHRDCGVGQCVVLALLLAHRVRAACGWRGDICEPAVEV